MPFPLNLEVVSSKDVKSKKRWRKIQWDGEESENISLLGNRILAQFNLVTGKKRRVDAHIRKLLGRVVYINGSTSGACIVGMLQDGHLFRWRKTTRTITNIQPCPDFTMRSTDPAQGQAIRKPKLFISDDGNTILLFSRWHGIRLWRGVGLRNSGWTNINLGSAASSLITSKGLTLDTVFYSDTVDGQICRSAFVSMSGDSIALVVLSLKYEETELAQSYAFHRYPLSSFHPELVHVSYRDSLVPCWSRNGLILAVAVNQKIPSSAKVLIISPVSGGVVSVSFRNVLKNAVEMSFWITGISWTYDHLFLACVTKQGAICIISANGNIMQIMAKSPSESFGPGIFLPLEGVVGFRRPALDNTYREIDDSTDTSMQSAALPPKLRRPHFSINLHPTLQIMLCADGYSVAAVKIMEGINHEDMIIFSIVETVQTMDKIIKKNRLQMNVLEPLSFFLQPTTKEPKTDREGRWRNIMKGVHTRLMPGISQDVAVDETMEKSPEQMALMSFLIENLDDSYLNRGMSQPETDAKDFILEDGFISLISDLKSCHASLLSNLMLLNLWYAEKKNEDFTKSTLSTNDRFTRSELSMVVTNAFKLYCDILLQIQDIADLLPEDTITDSFLSENGGQKSLKNIICSMIFSLGNGVLSLLQWTDLASPVSSITPGLIEEIVRSSLICGSNSSEGCISCDDLIKNLQKTLVFLVKAEKCMEEQTSLYMQSVLKISTKQSAVQESTLADRVKYKDIKFASAWKALYQVTLKLASSESSFEMVSSVDPLLSYLQMRGSENMILPSQSIDDEEIKATKSLLIMCEHLRSYNFTGAISLAYGILTYLTPNIKKWTDEKWLPVEILANVIASYFCGSPVMVPSLIAAISNKTKDKVFYNHSVQLRQETVTSCLRTQSLDESWNLNNAVLLLLSCGKIQEAADTASKVGDWRTSFILNAVSEKTSFTSKSTLFQENKTKIDLLLRKRYEDIMSSIFAVKTFCTEDSIQIEDKSGVNFAEVDAVSYAICLRDLFEVSSMVGTDITTWSSCAILNTIKSLSCRKVPLHVPVGFKLPHPQLYLPQFSAAAATVDDETKLRNEMSAYIRILLTNLNCIGIQRVVALWYLKWLDREALSDRSHHMKGNEKVTQKKKSRLADFALLKDVSVQGLELDLEKLHGSEKYDDVYVLAVVFREICAILWLFHIRDKLASALTHYQKIREELFQRKQEQHAPTLPPTENPVTEENLHICIHDCLSWIKKIVPFAKFFHLDVEIDEIVLCLISELPLRTESAHLLAQYFHQDKTVPPRNKNRLQALLEKMRKVHIPHNNEEGSVPLSAIFNEECRKLGKNRNPYSGHFHAPVFSIISKSGTSFEGSQTDTLTRDDPSVISKISSHELLETLNNCYTFESDELYREFVFDFLEIALSKSPATATFTPKKGNKAKSSSKPMRYPLVLTYRNEIARMNLETVSQPTEQSVVPLSIMVPVLSTPNISRKLTSTQNEDDNAESEEANTDSAVLNWEYFTKSEVNSTSHPKAMRLELKFIPRMIFKDLPPPLQKKLQRLIPYFEWLEHWRSQVIPMPQKSSLNNIKQPAMRITIGIDHIIHGFTMAEMRFGKYSKIKPPKVTDKVNPATKVERTAISEESEGTSLDSEETLREYSPEIDRSVKSISAKEMAGVSENESVFEASKKQPLEEQIQPSSSEQENTLHGTELHSELQQDELHSKISGGMINDKEEQPTEQKSLEENDIIKEPPENTPAKNTVPDPSSRNLLKKLLQKDKSQETQDQSTDAMSHSGMSMASTGLQSDLMPDGGGKLQGSRSVKLKEKEKQEMQEVVRNEIQNAMIGQQVLFLAQMFQSAMMHASNTLGQPPPIPPQITTLPPQPTVQPRQTATQQFHRKAPESDGKLHILTADDETSPVRQSSSFAKKPKRPVLKLLTENYLKKTQTVYLHDEKIPGPKLFNPQKTASKAPPPPPMHTGNKAKPARGNDQDDRVVQHQHEKSFSREAGTLTLTPDMLQASPTKCPTCNTQPGPKMAVRLPLLNSALHAKSTGHHPPQAQAIPRLVNIRQILHYEQKRMMATGQQSQSLVHVRNALPLLGAEKIQGFYRQVPQFQQVPSAMPTTLPRRSAEPPVKPVKAWEKEEQKAPADEPPAAADEVEKRVEIPKELLPKVITLEEAEEIRSGVLAHYKTIVDHQKMMWRESGQQTEEVDNRVDTGVGPYEEIPDTRMSRVTIPKSQIDRHDAHEQFIEKFLDPQRNRVTDLDHVPMKELKAQDVTRMDRMETEMKVPAVQNLVKSKWSSVMDQMSSEIEAVDQMERDRRYRIPVPIESTPAQKTASTSSSVHFAPTVSESFERHSPHSSRSRSPVSRNRSPVSRRSRSSHSDIEPSIQTYIPPSYLVAGAGSSFSERRDMVEKPYQKPLARESKFDELTKYRKRIDEAFSLAEFGPLPPDGSEHSYAPSYHVTSESSMHKMDGSVVSSLSWEELEAMVNESLLIETGAELSLNSDPVDGRIQDALQLLDELQNEQPGVVKKTPKKTKKQQKIDSKKAQKREADVNARLQDAMSLLNEIKTDHNQIKSGKLKPQTRMNPTKSRVSKSGGLDNWTMEAMSLLNELKSEYEPNERAAVKENLPPELFGKTDSDNMRAHIEEAMALLQDDDARSTPISLVPSSHVSFQPSSQMPKRYY